jgi:hypothetical protein
MHRTSALITQAAACWNWKCALLSAMVRSCVYLAALAHARHHGGLAIVAVEIAYVTATAGLYAGIQQQALRLRPRLTGDLVVVVGVPGLAQALDWLTHCMIGPAAPARVTVVVCVFTLISALFHLHVMRRGAFLTGRAGRSLADDIRRMPRLLLGFALLPFTALAAWNARMSRATESQAAL